MDPKEGGEREKEGKRCGGVVVVWGHLSLPHTHHAGAFFPASDGSSFLYPCERRRREEERHLQTGQKTKREREEEGKEG